MSSYCLASKMKRCRAFDLEQGEEEDEDESCQMEAKKKNRIGFNSSGRLHRKRQDMREGDLRGFKKFEEKLSSTLRSTDFALSALEALSYKENVVLEEGGPIQEILVERENMTNSENISLTAQCL